MIVFRIVQDKGRSGDLSGTGAFRRGGRWNSKGTDMLYTSENSSLAFLEYMSPSIRTSCRRRSYIMEIGIKDDKLIYEPTETEYPKDWKQLVLTCRSGPRRSLDAEEEMAGYPCQISDQPDGIQCAAEPALSEIPRAGGNQICQQTAR